MDCDERNNENKFACEDCGRIAFDAETWECPNCEATDAEPFKYPFLGKMCKDCVWWSGSNMMGPTVLGNESFQMEGARSTEGKLEVVMRLPEGLLEDLSNNIEMGAPGIEMTASGDCRCMKNQHGNLAQPYHAACPLYTPIDPVSENWFNE